MKKQDWNITKLFLTCLCILFVFGCAKEPHVDYSEHVPAVEVEKKVGQMNYALQVGAFAKIDNALKLTQNLNKQGLQAYYFIHKSGLYKVRFGNYTGYKEALARAKKLYAAGIISDYYIVRPEEFTVARQREKGPGFVRENLVATAERFLGIPYKWGGASRKTGFDCSGLSMVVYKINGINLPRNSRAQFNVGRKVNMGELRKGDLVFFATNGGRKVSHVGIYKGNGKFIHAPKKGKNIKISSMATGYFKKRFIGAKTYL